MLTVYKASAGSGKTFQLVRAYLQIILKNPAAYRNILAVTFTNKATNEMKSRILEQLFLLADNRRSAYSGLLQEDLSFTEERLRENAAHALKNILHDYNRFSISTIDAFTQRVIKAFNREMGISPHFGIGLDDKLILEEATDRLLAGMDTDSRMCRWLVKFSEEKIRENKSYHIEEDIKGLGAELFREKFQLFFPDQTEENSPYSRENLERFGGELEKILAWYRNAQKEMGKRGLKIMEQEGLEPDDFSGKSRGPGAFLVKLAGGELPNITATVFKWAEDAEAWYTKTSDKKDLIRRVTSTELLPLLEEILAFYRTNYIRFVTAEQVRRQLRTLGILTDLKDEVRRLLLEKEILQLSDSNLLLNRIIDGSDSPFIYEKIGSRFTWYMLDEFQDTSSLQWGNFKPLVANALAEGHAALLVGDVKQSIYRWRNSDWNILASQIHTDFPHDPPVLIPLEKNWRSLPGVIRFNNAAIGALEQTFESFLFDDIDEEGYREKFSEIYREYLQEPGKVTEDGKGLAEVHFLPKEAYDSNALNLLVEQVKLLQDNGMKASDIAILIRKNNEGAPIVEAFMEAAKKEENEGYNLTVLSSESLFLYASRGVSMVMLIIGLLVEPEHQVHKVALLHLWLSWLKPELESCETDTAGESGHVKAGGQNNNSGKWLVNERFEEVFEAELGDKMKQIRKQVLLTSLDETVTGICSLFGLFRVTSELPFLQTLIDQAAEIRNSLSNDLSNFLHWWESKGSETSVSANEEVDSVRLLTVHKSKGLEFEAVLIPFFNWKASSWSGNQTPLLWCRPDGEPFSRFPLLPVRATSKLSETIFRKDYFEEKVSSLIDTMNLIYVAFTRAKAALFVTCEMPEEKKSGRGANKPGKVVNDLLRYALDGMAGEDPFMTCWNEDKSIFRFGELPDRVPERASGRPDWISHYHAYDISERIRLRMNSEDFLMPGEQHRSARNTGKLVHEILAGVQTAKDIRPACERALREGKITEEEKTVILTKLESSLKDPVISSWFDEHARVLNERSLLDESTMLRPDRILISGDEAVVIDYKWGEKMPEKYRRQVSRYAMTLKKCGLNKVKGYLWYINQDEVEQVL